jgi:hypothetical protein
MTKADEMVTAEAYLKDCVRIEPLALEEEFVRLPADLAYWNDRYSEAYKYHLERKIIREQLGAELSSKIRDGLEVAKKTRVTIAEVDGELLLNPEYQQARAKEVAADAERVRLYGVLDALRSKRDMLISLGAHIRAEMQHDPMIRERAALDREVATNRTTR